MNIERVSERLSAIHNNINEHNNIKYYKNINDIKEKKNGSFIY